MKFPKKYLVILHFVIVTALILTGCGGNGTKQSGNIQKTTANVENSTKVIEMNVNNITSSTHPNTYNVFEPWAKLVEEKTNGRVKVNLYNNGVLGKSQSALQDVSGGVYDVGLALPTYFYDTPLFPFTIGNLPFAFPDAKTASKIIEKFGEKNVKDGLEDVIIMGIAATDPYDLFSVKPIRKLEDVKGLKMRVQGKGDNEIIKAWGGVPVSIPLEDSYEALEKGTLDTQFYTPVGVRGSKAYEVAPYITKIGIYVTPVIPIMNRNFYNKLPDDLKKLFDEELNPKLADLLVESYTKEMEKAYDEIGKAIKGKGEIITLSPEELQKFKIPAKIQWDKWVEDANSKGYPGEQMMNDFKQMLKDEDITLPF
ncbi:TRAP transporter substrate-binding protein DctP [Parageobacillus thermoglucosidasius]|uniref:TRAP transporter substrate-binding protein DctP n=1 Tax=Parageobacillus thermoglucosidasius TaxID=1426 RepID=UPI000B56C1D3|nr:TRAP transporter substrate-binding protein DctP [Parageobacillus thermoglucosidasius]OUM92073.1 MAG: hypothetical protein BAA00_07185 [Parageobacillus thermoglucosidasius]